MRPSDKNYGIHPYDPAYDDDFDYEATMEEYERDREMEWDDTRD